MIALFVLQVTTLAIVGVILAILMILAIWDHHRVRHTENFLLGAAYGLTLGMILATLYTISIPN
jgi:CDP-diglyceride synthetase